MSDSVLVSVLTDFLSSSVRPRLKGLIPRGVEDGSFRFRGFYPVSTFLFLKFFFVSAKNYGLFQRGDFSSFSHLTSPDTRDPT